MNTKTKASSYRDLAEKGEGVLVRRGNVWTFAGAETDRSGTNLQLPIEHISDAEVQEALRAGDLVPVTTHPVNGAIAVRLKASGEVTTISVVDAGTAEAGTELPPNSRPTHDAGMRAATPEEIERATSAQARQLRPEGAERRQGAGLSSK